MNARPIFTQNKPRFNIAVWTNNATDRIFLAGREIDAGTANGKPDIGRIFLTETDNGGQVLNDSILWHPRYDNFFLEDPRAFRTKENLIIGFTAVLRNKKGFLPFPAVVNSSTHDLSQSLPPVTIIEHFGPGKNLTPISHNRFVFRPDSTQYNHQLLVFELSHNIPHHLQDIPFPTDLPWAQWRLGTTMPPLWLSDTEALMIIHGITIDNGKYVYSLGRAKLSYDGQNYSVIVAPAPILTPALARQTVKYRELHPRKRRALYACGGIIDPNNPSQLNLYVNVGDTSTYIFDFPLTSLMSDLF